MDSSFHDYVFENLTKPQLILSITGPKRNFTFKNNRMKIALKRGLIELTQSIESWIVTNGYHSGIIFIIILQEYN